MERNSKGKLTTQGKQKLFVLTVPTHSLLGQNRNLQKESKPCKNEQGKSVRCISLNNTFISLVYSQWTSAPTRI